MAQCALNGDNDAILGERVKLGFLWGRCLMQSKKASPPRYRNSMSIKASRCDTVSIIA